jgi:four helix bundle protein
MEYKFQKLEVYKIALQYLNAIYDFSATLPSTEKYNLCTQIQRAGTSIVLNIAEASTGQTDPEQHRILGLAMRSYLETVACLDIVIMRAMSQKEGLDPIRLLGDHLFIKLQALRNSLR